jgi:hypothetical protein
MFRSVFVTNLFKIGRKFYQINIDVNCDKGILKGFNCVLGIFLKSISWYGNLFRYYKRFFVISFNEIDEIEIK